MKRLVELHPETSYLCEVDNVRLVREAKELLGFILALPPSDTKEKYARSVLPLCKGAIHGSVKFPIHPHEEPLNITRELDMGNHIPNGFEELYSRFVNTALGARFEPSEAIVKEGKKFVWVTFEENDA